MKISINLYRRFPEYIVSAKRKVKTYAFEHSGGTMT